MAPSDDQPGPRKRRTPPLRFVSATDEPDNDEETRRPPNSFMIFRTCIEHASKTDPRMPDIPQSIFSVVMSIFWTWYKARDASNYIQQKAEQIAHEHRVENPHYMYTPRQHTSKQQETAEHKALVRRHKQEMQAVKNAGLDIEGTHLAKKPTKKGKHAKGKNRYYARHQEEVERVMEPWIHRMLEHYGIRDGVLPHSFLQKMEEVRQTNKMKKSASEKRNQDKVDREGKNNAAAAEKAGDTGPSPRLSLASLPKSSDIPSSFKLTESATPESSAGSPPRQSPLPRRKAARRKNYPGQGEFFTRSSSEGFNDLSPLEATARPSVPQASGQAQPSTPPRPQGITIPSIPSMHQPPSSSPREEEMSFLQSMPRFQCLNLQFPNLRDGFDVLANTGFTFGNDDQVCIHFWVTPSKYFADIAASSFHSTCPLPRTSLSGRIFPRCHRLPPNKCWRLTTSHKHPYNKHRLPPMYPRSTPTPLLRRVSTWLSSILLAIGRVTSTSMLSITSTLTNWTSSSRNNLEVAWIRYTRSSKGVCRWIRSMLLYARSRSRPSPPPRRVT